MLVPIIKKTTMLKKKIVSNLLRKYKNYSTKETIKAPLHY